MNPVKIALVNPEIPPNTGNIGRVCVGLGLPLHLVGKLSFSLDDKMLRRAGLDYWPNLIYDQFPDEDAYRLETAKERPILFTTKGSVPPWEVDLTQATTLVFGAETKGLAEPWHDLEVPKICFPMTKNVRSYNLSNCVFAAAMEWARQTGWQI